MKCLECLHQNCGIFVYCTLVFLFVFFVVFFIFVIDIACNLKIQVVSKLFFFFFFTESRSSGRCGSSPLYKAVPSLDWHYPAQCLLHSPNQCTPQNILNITDVPTWACTHSHKWLIRSICWSYLFGLYNVAYVLTHLSCNQFRKMEIPHSVAS